MKSHPYLGINEEVKKIIKPLLSNGDAYHKVHTARLARTAHVLGDIVATEGGDNCKVLELGTSGFLPVTLKSLFPGVTIDVTSFDQSESLEEILANPDDVSEKEVGIGGESVRVTAFSVDLEYELIPAPDETYDVVVCCEVLEHMEIDPMFMLSEVNRVLKPGGKLLLTTPNVLSSRGIAKMLEGYEPYFFMQYHKNREYHRHNYEYSVRSLWSLLKCAGFDATVWTEDLFEDGLPHAVNRLRSAGFVIENVGDNILAIGTKISEVVERHPRGLYV